MQLAFVNDGDAPYLPAGHRVGVAVPASQKNPGGHGRVHASPSPTASLKVPAAQLLQLSAPPRLYCPGGHCTAAGTTEPAGQAYPRSQAPLHSGVVRPAWLPKRPPGHSPLQFAVPSAVVLPNLPAAQSRQMPVPAREYVPAGHATAVALVDPSGHA